MTEITETAETTEAGRYSEAGHLFHLGVLRCRECAALLLHGDEGIHDEHHAMTAPAPVPG